MKNKDILNLECLYYGTNEEVINALNEKRTWLDKKYIVEGDINYSFDEENKKHFDLIEAIYSGALLFSYPTLNELDIEDKYKDEINTLTSDLRILKLKDKIDLSSGAPFYLEYNFALSDLSTFRTLFPNFYRYIAPEEILSTIDFNHLDICDAIKCLIYSKTPSNSIILSKTQLINDRFPCSFLTKIYMRDDIDNELKITLLEVAKKFNLEVEEI